MTKLVLMTRPFEVAMKVDKSLLLKLEKSDREALERARLRLRCMNYSETLRQLIRRADENVTVQMPARAQEEAPCPQSVTESVASN